MHTATGRSNILHTAIASALLAATPQAGAADSGSLALEEVVVTATKVAESINATAAAVTVLNNAALGPGGILEVRDLAVTVPNLSVGDQFGVNRTFIRGIGMTSIDLGADGAVAFLQDGAMIPRPSHQLAGFYDLEQVEVLRGPQGTLYGRGATAGVVNMVTRKPTEELDGYVNYTLGNYAKAMLEGAIGGPINDDATVMGRISGRIDKRDGYGENLYTLKDIDDRNATAFRASLRFKPAENLDIVLMGDYFQEDDYNYAFHFFGTTATPEDELPHNLLGGRTIFDYYADLGQEPNQRNIVSDQDPINDRDGTAYSLLVEWGVADGWGLKSVTAWRDFNRFLRDDLDGSDVDMFGQNNYVEESTSFSQDFTLSGKAANVAWLMGVNYFSEDMYGEVKVPLTNLGLLFGLPADTFDDGNYWQKGDVEVEAYGVFVEGKYDFSEALALTLGARYNYEKRTGTGSFIFDAIGVNVPTDREKSWNRVTPRVLLEYTTGNDGMLYGQFTQGFKSGVINIGSLNEVIDPEYVDAFEVGYKTAFADNRASLRTAAFYYDYTDLQVGFVNEESVVQTVNAASAEIFGVEVELFGRLTETLSAEFTATWLDATYKEFVTGDYRQGFDPVDLSGNQLQNAPEYTLRVALDYRQPIGQHGALLSRIEGTYQDDVYFTEFNNADAYQEAYGQLNAQVGYEGGDGRWSAVGWVRNATDEFVISNNIITAPLYGSVRVGSLLPPRTYGLTLAYNF
jgi:iron complex outermembrane receptor protein